MSKIVIALIFIVALPFICIGVRFLWRWTNHVLRKAEADEFKDVFK